MLIEIGIRLLYHVMSLGVSPPHSTSKNKKKY